MEYNTAYLGSLGYQVYLDNGNGNLTPIGFTNNNSFTYTIVNYDLNYTFVVKSAFSIFKANMSSGTTIKAEGMVTPTPGPVKPTPATCDETISINDSYITKTAASTIYTDSIKVIDSKNNDISSKVYASPTKTQKWDDPQHKYINVDKIDRKDPGTYQISYKITYNECDYNVNHKIIVQ